jgi:hypothetical protein
MYKRCHGDLFEGRDILENIHHLSDAACKAKVAAAAAAERYDIVSIRENVLVPGSMVDWPLEKRAS